MAVDPKKAADQRAQAKARAVDAELSFEQTVAAELDTGKLLSKIDRLIHNVFRFRQGWEGEDSIVEARLRDIDHQLRAYRKKVEEMGEYQADEAQEIMDYVTRQLEIAHGETPTK